MTFNSINRVTILGRLGKDPEVKMMTNGKKVASFSVATSTSWVDKTGEKKELSDWHNIVVFNEVTAKFIESYVKKGSRVYIEGALKTRKWTDKTGNEKYTTEIVLSGFDCRLILLDNISNTAVQTGFNQDIQTYNNDSASAKKDDYDDFFKKMNAQESANSGTDDFIPF